MSGNEEDIRRVAVKLQAEAEVSPEPPQANLTGLHPWPFGKRVRRQTVDVEAVVILRPASSERANQVARI